MEQESRWRWGSHRWLVLLLIGLSAFIAYGLGLNPLQPHVQIAPEALSSTFTLPILGEFQLTNTLVAMLLADLVLLLLALTLRQGMRGGKMVLSGLAAVVETLVEALYNLAESTAGKWTKTIFPWMATIILLVLVANYTELFPGVDSVGLFEPGHVHEAEACQFDTAFRLGNMEVVAVKGTDKECAAAVVPFVRVVSTDLNFTLALAIIGVVMTQVIGIRALGLSYFTKFFNIHTLFNRPMFGAIDFIVSLLEALLEGVKVLSFSLRLFGNIFAGSVLLFVIGALVPVFLQSGVLLFEFFVGTIQALVFGMLVLIFMSLATVGHGTEEGH